MADPGTQAWLQWLSSMMAGGQPAAPPQGPQMMASMQPAPSVGPGAGNVGPVTGFQTDPTQVPPNPGRPIVPPAPVPPAAPPAAGSAAARPAPVRRAPLPPPRPPGLGNQPPPGYLTSTSATPPGSPGAPAPGTGPYDYPQSSTFSSFGPQTGRPPVGAPAPAIPPPRPPNLGVVPGAPSGGQIPNLGYYAPTSGNVRGPATPLQMAANDPRMYRGPLSMFGGGAAAPPAAIPPNATASVPPQAQQANNLPMTDPDYWLANPGARPPTPSGGFWPWG